MRMLFSLLALLVAGQAWAYSNLRGAIFSQQDLTGVDLTGANLQYAHFKNTTLTDAKLDGANLRGANFTGAVWVDGKTVCKKGSIGQCLAQEQAP